MGCSRGNSRQWHKKEMLGRNGMGRDGNENGNGPERRRESAVCVNFALS